jgi:hypothetical protein
MDHMVFKKMKGNGYILMGYFNRLKTFVTKLALLIFCGHHSHHTDSETTWLKYKQVESIAADWRLK